VVATVVEAAAAMVVVAMATAGATKNVTDFDEMI